MKPLRIYCDTSVIGGCFDAGFEQDSRRLVEAVRNGRLVLLLSDVVLAELGDAPARVQQVLQSLPETAVEKVELTEEVLALRDAYLAAKILGPRWADDAAHVAAATVAHADAIVSWNFQHIVRLDKMKAYNQVNLLQGYGILTIITPKEVLSDETTQE
jgi:predicted nucleic acid-binding protein